MWDKVVKMLCAAAGAIAGIFGGWNTLLTLLACAMAMDYVSGLMVAMLGKSPKTDGGGIDSKVGFIGLAKKGFIIMIVLLATLLDGALGTDKLVFQTATVCYYIANEGISIIENAGLIGIPVPPIIQKAMEQLKQRGDGDTPEKKDDQGE